MHKLFCKQPLLGAVLWSVLWSVYCNVSCDKILQRDWGALYSAPGQCLYTQFNRSSPLLRKWVCLARLMTGQDVCSQTAELAAVRRTLSQPYLIVLPEDKDACAQVILQRTSFRNCLMVCLMVRVL